jgi:hypothetical protein
LQRGRLQVGAWGVRLGRQADQPAWPAPRLHFEGDRDRLAGCQLPGRDLAHDLPVAHAGGPVAAGAEHQQVRGQRAARLADEGHRDGPLAQPTAHHRLIGDHRSERLDPQRARRPVVHVTARDQRFHRDGRAATADGQREAAVMFVDPPCAPGAAESLSGVVVAVPLNPGSEAAIWPDPGQQQVLVPAQIAELVHRPSGQLLGAPGQVAAAAQF